MKKKYFGTDGIRGKVGQFPITPDFVLKLGWAAGQVLRGQKQNRVVIGKDTRLSGYMFESALEAGLSSAGVDIFLLGPMPTASVAYLTRTFHANAGIVISASHNPYEDNGIKFFSSEGRKLPDEVELAIEAALEEPFVIVPSEQLGKAKRIDDAPGRYIEFCKSTFSHAMDLSTFKIVLDCAHGAAYQVAALVFTELGAKIYEIASKPDGFNINKACGAVHPEFLQKKVLAYKADLGIALDGDGDRVILVDHCGEIVEGDEILFILSQYFKPQGVVGTLMSNLGLEKAVQSQGIEFVRTPVGDRYIIEALEKRNWNLGGEGSGHIICREYSSTGDGIIAALQVLRAVLAAGLDLHTLKNKMYKFPQCLINVQLNKKIDLTESVFQEAVQQIEKKLQSRGRVLLRHSGTESVIRVMVEGEDKAEIKDYAQSLAEVIKNA